MVDLGNVLKCSLKKEEEKEEKQKKRKGEEMFLLIFAKFCVLFTLTINFPALLAFPPLVLSGREASSVGQILIKCR